MGDLICRWKMGFLETLSPLKNPVPPSLESVQRALGGLPYSNIVPVNRYVHFNYSMPIYALSHNHYIIMYMCQLITSLEEGIFAILLH